MNKEKKKDAVGWQSYIGRGMLCHIQRSLTIIAQQEKGSDVDSPGGLATWPRSPLVPGIPKGLSK